MVVYHPVEHHYWLCNHASSGRILGPPSLASSQFISALWLLWTGCGGALAFLEFRKTRRTLNTLRKSGAQGAVAEAEIAFATAKCQLTKLSLDAVLALHWTFEHPTWRLSDFQLGAIGTASTLFALHAYWMRHEHESLRLKSKQQ